jgi:hypothetical protein
MTSQRAKELSEEATNFCAIPTAPFLLFIGLLHRIVNDAGMRRDSIGARSLSRLGDSVLVNAAFSGVAMSLLGLLVLLMLPGLRSGSCTGAWNHPVRPVCSGLQLAGLPGKPFAPLVAGSDKPWCRVAQARLLGRVNCTLIPRWNEKAGPARDAMSSQEKGDRP